MANGLLSLSCTLPIASFLPPARYPVHARVGYRINTQNGATQNERKTTLTRHAHRPRAYNQSRPTAAAASQDRTIKLVPQPQPLANVHSDSSIVGITDRLTGHFAPNRKLGKAAKGRRFDGHVPCVRRKGSPANGREDHSYSRLSCISSYNELCCFSVYSDYPRCDRGRGSTSSLLSPQVWQWRVCRKLDR